MNRSRTSRASRAAAVVLVVALGSAMSTFGVDFPAITNLAAASADYAATLTWFTPAYVAADEVPAGGVIPAVAVPPPDGVFELAYAAGEVTFTDQTFDLMGTLWPYVPAIHCGTSQSATVTGLPQSSTILRVPRLQI